MDPITTEKHSAVAVIRPRASLRIIEVDTVAPSDGEILIRVEWTASTPLNLHNADGGLLITPPYIMSGDFAGTVVAVGDLSSSNLSQATCNLKVGDQVFGFAYAKQEHRPQQEYITIPAYLCSKLPKGLKPQEAVTVPSNFVTAMHTITTDLGLALPWPRPKDWTPKESQRNAPILVWGAGSSVGHYSLQVLKFWGYRRVIAVASARHHSRLRRLGASVLFDYGQVDVIAQIKERYEHIPYFIDCIGSVQGTLTPLSKIAGSGSVVAVMLPVIVAHASAAEAPEYEMDVSKVLAGQWQQGVELRGVRTHFYTQNDLFKYHLQPEIMPELLAQGSIEVNKQRLVEGESLLVRAEKALGLLREGQVRGEKLIWRVAE
ncbi:chaperonin 10-like protein [Coniella lustricola]|uniref:Chaperonin 10-like protein n=1 Tax=Coniella lustricola TaxID=2025994 RepID=A0A2T3AD54_9PEZI|nr:chaperonin 10-like protein [Coniella lustricola]